MNHTGRALAVLVVIASVVAGCATARPRMLSGRDSNAHCDWTFATDPATGKAVKGTLKVTPKAGKGPCALLETDELYVVGTPTTLPAQVPPTPATLHRVIMIDAIEFTTAGSCRRCYTNTSGGMTCVEYPGPPC